ncbi:hypothetical protein [Pseudoflavonifractor sp. AF19-9AC]|uniref:hypothetical protein n=1 Tax=Pseudoflavonifractor sp. AF19-9AC TaxID=2292244 RepID=UPI001FAA51D1|nr:hypothetical protein [Pseudoflavonifractor sp. AF19-9AC]
MQPIGRRTAPGVFSDFPEKRIGSPGCLSAGVTLLRQGMAVYRRRYGMYLEIKNPMDYHAALYIRLSKEDESEGLSQIVQNQESLLWWFIRQYRLGKLSIFLLDTSKLFAICSFLLHNWSQRGSQHFLRFFIAIYSPFRSKAITF